VKKKHKVPDSSQGGKSKKKKIWASIKNFKSFLETRTNFQIPTTINLNPTELNYKI